MDNEKNTPKTSSAPETPDAPKTSNAPETPDAPKTSSIVKAHGSQEMHEAPISNETPEVEFVLSSKEQRRRSSNGSIASDGSKSENVSGSENVYTGEYNHACNSSIENNDGSAGYGSNSGNGGYGSCVNNNKKNMNHGVRKDSAPASKRFVAIVLVIAVIVSGLLGAGIATFICNSNKSYSNLNYNNLADATGSEMSVQEIVALNEDAVVEITTEGTSQNYFGQTTIVQGAGSGVIINENGYIVTNNHVIDGASTIEVTLHNGDSYSASLVGTDTVYDIAILKISANNLTAATIGSSSELQVGDLAVAIGNPLGKLGGTATAGIISALERRLNLGTTTLDLLQTDASINPGNSGGGLFNQKGELVGIVVAKSSGSDVEGLGFAIPIDNIASVIDDLIDDGQISSKPAIGITIYDVDDDSSTNLEEGTYIGEVNGAKAKEAGFKVGDRIISIDGKEIDDKTDLISRVRKYNVGDAVKIVIERNGSEKTIETVLEEASAVS